MKDDFGIIPYPKYDETQTEYISSASSNFLSVCAVPVTNDDLENTGAFMEYLRVPRLYGHPPAVL